MKRPAFVIIPALSVLAAIAGGCTSHQTAAGDMNDDGSVALSLLGPVEEPASSEPDVYRLGAGDSLGKAVFAHYVALVRTGDHAAYAQGE